MYCPVCKRETSPITIGVDSYCSVCGNAYKPKQPAAAQAPAAAPTASVAAPAKPPAQALHQRVKPAAAAGGTIDLRDAASAPQHTPAASGASITHSPHHAHLGAAGNKPTERRERHFTERFEHARQVSRSAHISRFSDAPTPAPAPAAPAPAPTSHPHSHQPTVTASRPRLNEAELPGLAATQHEAMGKLPRHAPAPTPAAAPHTPPSTPKPHAANPAATRTLSIAAAVVIMGAYIWMQNYPKLAIQDASDRAGLQVTLPSYLPSSYTLAHTDTSPGLVTLNFSSPSADPLKISQHRTTWDSSSLLDNYIAKNTDDYAAIQGQGLTIYIFGQNQASWVNHGIWYSIEGATRLSREQILKIAYSL